MGGPKRTRSIPVCPSRTRSHPENEASASFLRATSAGPQDGVDYALRALAQLHGPMGRDDLHTTFIGGGDAFDDVVALAGRLSGSMMSSNSPAGYRMRPFSVTCPRRDVCLSPDPRPAE